MLMKKIIYIFYYLFYYSGTIQIKTEDVDLVDIIPVDDASGSGVDTNNHSKIKTLKRDIVDLTIDSDGEDSPTQAKQSKTEEDNDVKPDISKIKIEPNQEKPKQSCVNRNTQTDKDSTEDVVKKRLHAFQVNVHKLLKMIVPDEDLGPPENVEDIVSAMIKHNS